jgi:multidrug resistance protein MdtO
MATAAQPVRSADFVVAWFWNLIKKELAPYPGRMAMIARIVAAASITTLIIMTFRLPSAALSAFYVFVLSRESPRATLESGVMIVGVFCAGGVVAIVGAMIAVDYPLTHFLWVVIMLFLVFFVIRVVPNYVAGAAFSFMIVMSIPSWDVTGPTSAHVTAILWTTYSVSIGVLVTISVEYIVQSFHPQDNLFSELNDRLTAVEDLLQAYGQQTAVSKEAESKLSQYATVGSSGLRMRLSRTRFDPRFTGQMNATISLVDRLVDISANLAHLDLSPDQDERTRMRAAATHIADIRSHLMHRKPPRRLELKTQERPSPGIPLLPDLERTIALIPYAFVGENEISASLPPSVEERGKIKRPWVEDAFTNSDHLQFALKGTAAATASYIIYNALDWPGLSTCLATCVITALSNVGASRQKQILRIIGATIGGFIFGMGAQAFVFPGIDSITGFLLVFAAVTGIAAWVSTSSPKISYVGLQIALAWDLINLSDPRFQTSLTIARDRVVGVLLGLVCMWIFYEQFWPIGAAQQMLEIFTANLQMIARLAVIATGHRDRAAVIREIRQIRDKVNNDFAAVNAQADVVHFEFGSRRSAQLIMRQHILKWQPTLRTLFLLQLAVLRYRLESSIDESASEIANAQHKFDNSLAATLNAMMSYLEFGTRTQSGADLLAAYQELERAIREGHADVPTRAYAILALSQTMARMVNSLYGEMLAVRLPFHIKAPHAAENAKPTMQTR